MLALINTRVRRRAVAIVVALGAILILLAPTQAFASPAPIGGSGASRIQERAHYVEFVFTLSRFKNIQNQDRWAELHLAHYRKPIDKKLDWSSNGCSVPELGGLAAPVKKYADKNFGEACNRHDFGYRNYGSDNKHGPHLNPTEGERTLIDNRLLFEMRAICARRKGLSGSVCRKEATAVYHGARDGGAPHFF